MSSERRSSRGCHWLLLPGLALALACGSTDRQSGSGAGNDATGSLGQDCDAGDDFENTFDAIQIVIFEGMRCDNGACHARATPTNGQLDLSRGHAYASLVDVAATGSPLDRVEPRSPASSYLFRKLAHKIEPDFFPVAGSGMPVGSGVIDEEHLEALRLWIEAGAPETGSVADTLGRGERAIEELLDVCLPDPEPVSVEPLAVPPADEGIQLAMPAHEVPAQGELEICFGVYFDFRDRIPERFKDPTGDWVRVAAVEAREDPNTHHLTLAFSGFRGDMVHHPSYGTWTCVGGHREGELCEPLESGDCGEEGFCRAAVGNNVACIGYGPPGSRTGATPQERINDTEARPGFYAELPTHGILHWNSHAFNLTDTDALHHAWKNLWFTDDLRFQEKVFQDARYIFAAAGTPAFTRQEVCRDYVLPEGTRLIELFSHTHKRGESFTIADAASGELLYESYTYDEPLTVDFDPPRLYDSPDPAERTLRYCAVFDNGVGADGLPDPQTVTRLSHRPVNASACVPTHCAEGVVGARCNPDGGPPEEADHRSCDSGDGSADGACDACAITAGVTTDDEMFILLGAAMITAD